MASPADLGKLFQKGTPGEQLLVWGLLNTVLAALLAPELTELQRGVNSILQATPLPPADLADMVNRAIVTLGDGEAYAKQSGIAPSDFLRLVQAAGNAISPQEAVLAMRRGIITRDGRGPDALTFEQAIAESRIRDKWVPVIERLGAVPLPVADAVDAVVESQVGYDEGQSWAQRNGVDPDVFRILVNTRGNPPSPTQLVTLLRRGLIPREGTGPNVVSVQQGIYEGATKNKWWELLAALSDYVPPPRTVTALIREGSITDEQGLRLFQASGLDQELATAYVHSAHHQKLAAQKELAAGTIDTLYHDQAIDAAEADGLYALLGYTPEESAFSREVQDLRRVQTALTSAIGRVHSLYVNHKIGRTPAVTALDALRVPAAQRDGLLADWDVERTTNVKVLPEAQVTEAFYRKLISQSEASDLLATQGYTPFEAWVLLSNRAHAALPNRPDRGAIA